MRVTSKGQITIPQGLRERYGLGPGTEVEVVAGEEGPVVRAAAGRGDGDRLLARLLDRADSGMSADEILRMTRGEDD